MNKVEAAFQRLQSANPEPNLNALVASTQSRTTGPHLKGNEAMNSMKLQVEERPARVPSKPRWIPALAAAVVVIALIAAVPALVGGGDDFASLSEAEIASAFLAGQVESPSQLFADDAVVEHRLVAGGDVDGWQAWTEAVGYEMGDIDCRGDSEVACTFTVQLEAAAVQGLGPYLFNSASFTFADGQITRWADLSNPQEAAQEVWDPFFQWLEPELHDQMYRVTDTGQIQPLLTEQALDLWEQQMQAYIAGLSG